MLQQVLVLVSPAIKCSFRTGLADELYFLNI